MYENPYQEEYKANNEIITKLFKRSVILAFTALFSLIFFVALDYVTLSWVVAIGTLISCYAWYDQTKQLQKRNNMIFNKAYPPADKVISDYQQSFSNNNQTSLPESKFGYLEDPNDYNQEIIVSPTVTESINKGIGKIKHKDFLYNSWNLKSIDKMENKNIFNFYGPPGTGKTISARKVAKILNKKLFIVKYDQVESRYVGEAEKNISSVFSFAKENDAILFLDEADSLVSQRVQADSANGQHLNASKNVFMQELDKFNGIMILTTNLFSSFDPAILRRVNQNIKFDLPNREMRLKIFKNHIPEAVNRENIDWDKMADLTSNFSGGDIKNVTHEAMINAINEADQNGDILQACLTEKHLIKEINKIKLAKNDYFQTNTKTIGITQE